MAKGLLAQVVEAVAVCSLGNLGAYRMLRHPGMPGDQLKMHRLGAARIEVVPSKYNWGVPPRPALVKTRPCSFVTLCGRIFYDTDPQYFPRVAYRGRTIFLCTESCLGAFEADPAKFYRAHRKSNHKSPLDLNQP